MNIKSTKYIFSLFVTIIGIIVLISGGSYAILSGSSNSSNIHIVKAGSVELEVNEKYNTMETGFSIMKDADGLMQETVFEFTITNIGSVPAKYDLKLLNTAPSGQTALSNDYIRVGLQVNGQEMGPMGLSNVNNVIDSNTINNEEVIRYKMRVWLDKNQASAIQSNSTKKAYLSLKVEAKQSSYTPSTYIYRNSTQSISIGDLASNITEGTDDPSSLDTDYYLRHTIVDNKVTEHYVCYTLNNQEYCLKGGDANTYELNKQILNDSFGASNCNGTNDPSYSYYTCSSGSLLANTESTGAVDVGTDSSRCRINEFGRSYRSFLAGD